MKTHAEIWIGFSTKSYLGRRELLNWCSVASQEQAKPQVQRFLVPSYPDITTAIEALGSDFLVGAQGCGAHPAGPHTSEVAASLIREIGAQLVELGHAEQRASGDDDEKIAMRVAQAQASGLKVLLCIGEDSKSTPADAALECARQVRAVGVDLDNCILAYEPRWAIGADQPAPVNYVIDTVAQLRRLLPEAEKVSIIYGGTAGPGILAELYPHLSGLFLGRRVHNPAEFNRVVREANDLVS